MKKINVLITSLFILFAFQNTLQAQDNEKEKESTNCVGKGKFIIDAYYGYPYLFGQYIKQAINENTDSPIQVTNLNHLGFKFEYMINKMVGLGLDYTYASVIAKYSETNNFNQRTDYTASITKQRFLAKVNIHFATTKYLDPYATAGIGYKQSLVKSNNINDQDDVYELNHSILNVFPVSFRLGAGLRYYFIENLGICVEAGIGGPIIQGGITGKF